MVIKDNSKRGTGGFATVREGGINFRYVKIFFKSQTGGDIKFVVELYANSNTIQSNLQAQQPGWIYPQNVPNSYANNYPIGYQPPHQPYPFNRF